MYVSSGTLRVRRRDIHTWNELTHTIGTCLEREVLTSLYLSFRALFRVSYSSKWWFSPAPPGLPTSPPGLPQHLLVFLFSLFTVLCLDLDPDLVSDGCLKKGWGVAVDAFTTLHCHNFSSLDTATTRSTALRCHHPSSTNKCVSEESSTKTSMDSRHIWALKGYCFKFG